MREVRVARALREVAGALGASLELDELLDLVLEKLIDLVRVDHAHLFILDERKRQLVSRAESPEGGRLTIDLGDGALGYAIRTGRPLRVDDFVADGKRADWDEVLGYKSQSALVLPLKNNLSRTIGAILAVRERLPRKGERAVPFSEEDEEIVGVLAKQAAVAIDNSRLLVTLIRKNQQLQQAQEQLMRRVRDLELLFELERATAHAHSYEELARAVLERLARACGAREAILVLKSEDAARVNQFNLTLHRGKGRSQSELPGNFRSTLIRPAEGVLASVLATGVPVQVQGSPPDPDEESLEPLLHGDSAHGSLGVSSLIAEPLDGDTGTFGAIGLLNKQAGPFTAEDLGLLRLVGANVSTAVRLFDSSRAREREERLSAIGRLLSQVVHDLKSPLTVISGYVELMSEAEDRELRHKYAAEVLKQFEALGAMQREVLAFARGETKVFIRRVLLDRFFADLGPMLERELEGKKVELHIDCERRLVAHFDSERITRALQNLVRNAAEAMAPRGGKVMLEARARGQDLLLRVTDTGPGVPPEIAPMLFESFVTAGKPDGTGLGLAIVKRIVNEHGGTVSLCESGGGPETGGCFSIVLPGAIDRKKT